MNEHPETVLARRLIAAMLEADGRELRTQIVAVLKDAGLCTDAPGDLFAIAAAKIAAEASVYFAGFALAVLTASANDVELAAPAPAVSDTFDDDPELAEIARRDAEAGR